MSEGTLAFPKPKYEIGQEVYFIDNHKITCARVVGTLLKGNQIRHPVSRTLTTVSYNIIYFVENGSEPISEAHLFWTKEALIDSL